MIPRFEFRSIVKGRFRLEVVDAESGAVVSRRRWQKNLVTDRLLDGLDTRTYADSMQYCVVGTGSDPMHIDSGSLVASRTGDVVTSDGAIFDAAHVGAIIKWDSGEQARIAAFTDSQTVQTVTSGAIGSGAFTIHRVNLVAMSAEAKRSNTYVTGSSNCGSSFSSALKSSTIFLTYLFSVEVAPQSYTEIGLSNSGSAGANLNARALISGGVGVAVGQQLRVKYELTVTLQNDSAQEAVVLPITGIPDQNATQQAYLRGIEVFTSAGAVTLSHTQNALEPSEAKSIAVYSLPPGAAPGGFSASGGGFSGRVEMHNYGGGVAAKNVATSGSYTSGQFYRDYSTLFSTSQANGTLEWIGFGSSSYCALLIQMDTPFAKTADDTLALAFRLSWGRDLVN